MKKLITYLLLSITLLQIQAQNQLVGHNVQWYEFPRTAISVLQDFEMQDVASDFGRREGNSRWHKGVDFSPEGGNGDLGYAIRSLTEGTITKIKRIGNYKIVVVEEDDNDTDRDGFGYGHIFRNNDNTVGDFILATLTSHPNYNVIIYDWSVTTPNGTITERYALTDAPLGSPGQTYSLTYNGYTFVENPDPAVPSEYMLTNSVSDNDGTRLIGPIGDSSAPDAAHIHLYSLVDTDPANFALLHAFYGQATIVQNFNNTKDPLEFIQYDSPNEYEITIPDIRREGSLVNNNILYGNANIRIVVEMENSTTATWNNSRYTNMIFDINKLELLIKPEHEPDNNQYELIQGAYFDSYICDGSAIDAGNDLNSPDNLRYPSTDHPVGNTDGGDPRNGDNQLTTGNVNVGVGLGVDIAQRKTAENYLAAFGDYRKTGIIGHAYGTGENPEDIYFINDFLTKIRITDNFGRGNALMAREIQEARFPDGQYHLVGRATEVRLDNHDNFDSPSLVTIDNFKPYIKDVEIFVFGQRIYHKNWIFDQCGGIVFNEPNEEVSSYSLSDLASNSLILFVETSEPVQNLQMDIPFLFLDNIAPTFSSPDNIDHIYFLGGITEFDGNADLNLHFEAEDLAGNELLDLSTYINDDCVQMPNRDVNGWNNPDNIPEGVDNTHLLPCYNGITVAYPTINEPSECGVEDGGIRHLGAPSGGIYPYSGVWTDENGNIIPPGSLGWIYVGGVTDGIYTLTLTDAMGCSAEFIYEVIAENGIVINAIEIDPACENINNGRVGIAVHSLNETSGPYTFTWSNGQITNSDYASIIESLNIGIYTVTISDENSNCEIIREFEVELAIPDAPLNLGSVITHSCPGENSGRINLNITGGIELYEITWDNNLPPNNNVSSLSTGTYNVTVTDHCQESVSGNFTITELNVLIQTTPSCRDEGEISVSPDNGNSPYTYFWSNGQTTQNITGLNSGEFSVTITDASGCTISEDIQLKNKDFSMVENLPCVGFNDGTVLLEISNPESELVEVIHDDIALNIPPISTSMELEISSLSGLTPYTLEVSIGDCNYEQIFELEELPTENVFDRFEDETCYFDQYCDGVIIGNDLYQTTAWFDYNNAGGGWLSRCYVDGYCGNNTSRSTRKTYNKRTVRALKYYRILLAAQVTGNHTSQYIQSLLIHYDSRNLDYCDKVKFCPTNLRITSIWRTLSSPNNVVNLGGDCWGVECSGPWNDYSFCTNDIVPDYFGDGPNGDITYTCNPRRYNLYQLILWKQDLEDAFGTAFTSSQLFGLIEDYENDDERALCASVIFCKSDFSVLFHDTEQQTCPLAKDYSLTSPGPGGSVPFVWRETCVPVHYLVNGEPVPFLDSNGNYIGAVCSNGANEVVEIYFGDFPGINLFFAPGTSPAFLTLTPGEAECSQFVNFGQTVSEGVITPKGLFSTDSGNGFYDFTHYSERLDLAEIPDVQYYLEDMDTDQTIYVERNSGGNDYSLYYEDSISSWSQSIVSEFVDISFLTKMNNSIYLGGVFTGDLQLDGTSAANSQNNSSGFLFEFSSVGDPINLITIPDVSSNEKLEFIESGNDIYISGRTVSNNISVGGNAYNLLNSQGVFSIRIDSNNQVTLTDNISLDNSITLMKHIQRNENLPSTRILQGAGTVKVDEVPVISDNQEKLIILTNNSDNSFKYIKSFDLLGLDMDKMDGVYDDEGNLYLGLTFNNSVVVEGITYTSIGGDDILLLKFSQEGSFVGSLVYGSGSDENVCNLLYDNGLLYFGGDFSGIDEDRNIGRRIFSNLSECSQSAYISYVFENDFQNGGGTPLTQPNENELIISKEAKAIENTIRAFPNPFDEVLNIEIVAKVSMKYDISIINTLGSVLISKSTNANLGSNIIKLDKMKNFVPGIYYLQVTSEIGDSWIQKIIKN
ncbi:MAG: hypothetical protein ACI9AT_000473 [Ulvibacter sp.]|jgi:hypothetical protein